MTELGNAVQKQIGRYREKYTLNDAAFSSDGSLLALAYSQVVTIWDPQTTTLANTLIGSPTDPVR